MKSIKLLYILILVCVASLMPACRSYRLDAAALSSAGNNLDYNGHIILSETEEKVRLLLIEVVELRQERDSLSQYYKNGDDPAVWRNILRELASVDSPEFDHYAYLEQLRKMELFLRKRAVVLSLQTKLIHADVN